MRKNLIIKYLCLLGCFWVKIDFLADGFNIKKFTSLVRLTPPRRSKSTCKIGDRIIKIEDFLHININFKPFVDDMCC